MKDWSLIETSGEVSNANGAGRYFCYCTCTGRVTAHTVCDFQIIFQKIRLLYYYQAALADFLRVAPLWDINNPTVPLFVSSQCWDIEAKRIFYELRDLGEAQILLHAKSFQRDRSLSGLHSKFKQWRGHE